MAAGAATAGILKHRTRSPSPVPVHKVEPPPEDEEEDEGVGEEGEQEEEREDWKAHEGVQIHFITSFIIIQIIAYCHWQLKLTDMPSGRIK